jgi:hypothetical protein
MTLQGYYSDHGPGWRLAKSLVTLAAEITVKYPQATCLGTIGDPTHQSEGIASDHNPFVTGPDGAGIVRAIDIGGPNSMLVELRQFLWAKYAAQDPRVFYYGYMKGCGDNLINNWGLPFGTHVDTGDAGHLHISVTRANATSTGHAAYVAAIDSTASWGLASSGGTTPTPGEDDMSANKGTYEILQNTKSGAVRAAGPGIWIALEGKTSAQTKTNITNAMSSPLCVSKTPRRVSDAGMTWWKTFYINGKV